MTSSSPSLRELTATVPLPGDDEAATHRWAKRRWAEIHERAKKLAEENEVRRASLPPEPPPSSRSPHRPTLRRCRFPSESTNEAVRAMRRNHPSAPSSTPSPRRSRSMLAVAALVLLVVGSVVAWHGWPF
ncbi:MAG: hypothetical protein RIF41_12710 [Polyangiaceae bacterium]